MVGNIRQVKHLGGGELKVTRRELQELSANSYNTSVGVVTHLWVPRGVEM